MKVNMRGSGIPTIINTLFDKFCLVLPLTVIGLLFVLVGVEGVIVGNVNSFLIILTLGVSLTLFVLCLLIPYSARKYTSFAIAKLEGERSTPAIQYEAKMTHQSKMRLVQDYMCPARNILFYVLLGLLTIVIIQVFI